MEKFCQGDPFWDTDLTWNSDWPQFSACFQHTALPWVACGFLWMTSPFYVYYLSSRMDNMLPFTPLFVLKVFACGSLIVLRFVQLLDIMRSSLFFNDEVFDYAVNILTYLLLLWILILEKRKGVITSPLLFFFWLTSCFVYAVPVYSAAKLNEANNDVFKFAMLCIVYGFTFVSFLATCFAETIPPGSFNTNGNLEVSASVLSRITFWWTNRMLINGFKKLKEEHLIPLNPRDITATTVPVFLKHLRIQEEKDKYYAWLQRRKKNLLESSFYYQNSYSPAHKKAFRKEAEDSTDEKTPLLLHGQSNYRLQPEAETKSYLRHVHDEAGKSRYPKGQRGKVSIFRVILKTFWWQLLSINSLMIAQTIAILVNPLIMKAMINFTEDKVQPSWKGYLYAAGMLVMSSVQSLTQHTCLFYTTCLAMRISASITCAVYTKALTMNSQARRESTVGEIVNLMSVDARNIEMYTTYSFWLWMSPTWVIIALYLLYETVGVSMFAGLGFMAILFAVNTFLMDKLRVYQKVIMKIRDKRVKAINEVLNGIKILKLYAWEPSFEKKVADIRNEELKTLLKSSFIGSFLTFAWTAALYWMTLFTFMTYVYVDESHQLNASTSFVALSYFNIIRMAVNIMPIMIREGVKSIVSIGRINKYLNTPDLDETGISRTNHADDAIVIRDGTFAWDPTSKATLTDINLRIPRGSLVAVVGQVGAGKSSLISAMLGEMDIMAGNVDISGSVAYVPQQAWIQNDTLRNNVLFGIDYEQPHYDEVIDACALRPDLEILPAGDLTEIGEKGINLSGGQKQRVSLARALYHNADVILLDDPLSAVDSHVGKHIFSKVIAHGGMLQGKTRVLVTHGLQWLPRVDLILVVVEGRISEMGSYEELMSHNGPFASFLATYLAQHVQHHEDEDDSDDDDDEARSVRRDILQRLVSVQTETESDEENAAGQLLQRLKSRESEDDQSQTRKRKRSEGAFESSTTSGPKAKVKDGHGEVKGAAKVDRSKLMTEEEVESGRVEMKVYLELARALGLRFALLMLVLFSIYNVAALAGNLWLSAWTDDAELGNLTLLAPDSGRRRQLNDFYLAVYAALGVAQTVFVVAYAILMAFRQIHASRLMHGKMLRQLLRAPMAFFDTTPLGRIVNRFSQDMDMLDSEVCIDVEIWVDNVEKVLSTVIAISYTTPIFLAVFAPAFILYYFIMRFYVVTTCQIRRLQSKRRSPIYSHFGESLTGAHVIRAYGAQSRFIAQSQHRVDELMTCSYNGNAAARWLGVRLDFLGCLLIFFAAIFTVLSRDTLSAGIVGLSLSYAMEITGKMNMVVRIATEMETNIVSVERIAEYTRVQSEAPWTAIPRPRPEWPQKGEVRFQGYSTRYRPGLDLVLRDLTCDVKAGEKVGIVGRTGAGKSSLTLALFRLVEAAGGKVIVDDVDIASLGLHDLRNKLNILPQDPVIFDGTIRMNLDPFDCHSDDQMWMALEQAHLKKFVQDLPDKLEHMCGEGGENLSVGQRQLLCLARALLRRTQILVLDEATAAVDMETDELIQATIREAFRGCTVLTIAHRLHTVLDYDRILVLDNGKVVEFDSPTALLQNPDSAFYNMAKDAGIIGRS